MLVVYYSATGNTESVANDIAAALDADVFELEPVDPYTEEDLNWTDDNSRVVAEYENEDERDVELVNTSVDNWEEIDTVFIGYPIWWGIAAWPVNQFHWKNGHPILHLIFFRLGRERRAAGTDGRDRRLAGRHEIPVRC